MKNDIVEETLGEELQYMASYDSVGNPLEGERNYKMNLPPNIPARHYWSVILYDSQSRLMIQNDQLWPSVYSNSKTLEINQDGSIDVLFSPNAPGGKENNWVKTIPGKTWYLILRLYGPMESWFNKRWRPGEIESFYTEDPLKPENTLMKREIIKKNSYKSIK